MNCALCSAPIPDGNSTCSCCGASCEAPGPSEKGGESLDQCLPVGTSLLNGHYRTGRVLGQGGFGVTYQGCDIPMQLPVAIKEFFPSGCFRHGLDLEPGRKSSLQEFAEQRMRFLDEARVLARLNHPGIVRVYTAFEENHTAYMVMEYLRGQTLETRITERRQLGEDEVRVYFQKLAEALEVVHGHGHEGVLHRDIKPSNVMVTPESRVVLIDFGAARQFAANVSRAMSQVLTPGYAPLEQYSARARFGPPVDIYALGATMYHAITGQAPPEAVERSQGVELTPPHRMCPWVSQRTSDTIMAAMEMVAAHRPQSVVDLLGMLQHGAPPSSAPGPAPGPAHGAATAVGPPKPALPAIAKAASPPPRAALPAGLRVARCNPKGYQELVNEKDRTVLVRIPGGTFQMGSNHQDDEKPPHAVTLPPYLLGRVPVTNAQFARFVAETGFYAGNDWKTYASKWGEEAPVVCVNWTDATAYCAWAGLRLPTEAEWEFAARGPQGWVYPWGNQWDPSLCQNPLGATCPDRAASVGSFPRGASPFGCLDMAGNVWEWTDSCYDRYPGNTQRNDSFGTTSLVVRGGAWNEGYILPTLFRGANRNRRHRGDSLDNCGFRCALAL